MEERAEKLLHELEQEIERKTPRSKELYGRALRVLPGGVTYHIRWFSPYPIYAVKAKGPYVWDVDGNQYIDLWMGHGAHIAGHNPDYVMKKVVEVLEETGSHLGFENPYAVEYAELLTRIIPSAEKVRFTNSGTEASMFTVRLVRAFTRRKRLIKINGGWHGAYDALHVAVTPPYNVPETAGLPEDYVRYTTGVPFNDVEAVERELKRGDVAAVIVEPVLGAGGCIEAKTEYLKQLRELTERYEALLVFDEVITGFRLSLGGGQEYYNVTPDVTILGKAVGGGYPGSGAIAGREEVMKLLDHLSIPDPRQRSGHGGTFTGNPVTIVAGYALVSHLYRNRSRYVEFNSLWDWVRRRIQEVCDSYDAKCYATGAGSMVGIHFTHARPWRHEDAVLRRWGHKTTKALHKFMLARGVVYLTENMVHFLPSMAHERGHAEKVVELFEEFISRLTGK
jgi:glutamate-1-semialdehyde 2,1-aminomutase